MKLFQGWNSIMGHKVSRAPRMMLLAGILAASNGCQVYHGKPLPRTAVSRCRPVPAWKKLRVAAARIHSLPLPPLPLQHAEGLTPAEAAVLAVLLNPSLRALRDQRGEAAAQVLQAGLLPNPQLTESTSLVTGGYRTGTFTGYGAGLSWNIARLINRSARLAAARYHRGQVDLEVAWREWQTALAARLAVYDVLAIQRELAQARLARDHLRHDWSILTVAFHKRLATLLEVTAARSAERQAENRVLQLKQQLRQHRILLNRALGLPPPFPANLRIDGTFPRRLAPPQASLLLDGIPKRRLDLLALRLGYRSAQEKLRAAVLQQFPRISIGFQQGSDTSNLHTTGFGVTLDLPIFDHNQGRIASAKASRKALYDTYVARTFTAQSDAYLALANLHALQPRIRASRQAVTGLEMLRKTYAQALQFGGVDVVSYYTVVTRLSTEKIHLLRLKDQAVRNWIALAMATGLYLPLEQPRSVENIRVPTQ